MECVLNISKYLQNQRNTYNERVNNIPKIQITDSIYKYNSKNILTEEEIYSLYLSIPEENSNINPKSEKKIRYAPNYLDFFTNINNHLDKSYKENHDSAKRSSIPETQRFQEKYLNCIKIIKENNINIFGITKNFNKDDAWNMPKIFIFNCTKNNYSFKINFVEFADYGSGDDDLRITKITNIETGEKITFNCDLLCNYTSKTQLNNFLILTKCKNIDEFYNKRFGHYNNLKNLFEKNGIIVIDDIKLDIINISLDKLINFDFYLTIKYKNDFCSIIMNSCDYEIDDYTLFIIPEIKELIAKNDINFVTRSDGTPKINLYDIDKLYNHNHKINYNNENKFDDLLKHIECFFDEKNNKYGILVGNNYFNDKNFTDYFKYSHVSTFIDIYNGIDFDMLVTHSENENYYKHNINLNLEYPVDFYALRFYCDKKISQTNCFLTIQGKYYDLNHLVRNNLQLEDYKFGIKTICNFTFSGSYEKCFDKIKEFFDNVNINKLNKSDYLDF
jgi:hypothetical protein